MDHKKLYSVTDAVRMLGGIQEYRIQYCHRTNKVPSPAIFAGRRLYTWADIEQLARHFGVDLAQAEAEGGHHE